MALRNHPVSRSEIYVIQGRKHRHRAIIAAVPLDACEPYTPEAWRDTGKVFYKPLASLFADRLTEPPGLRAPVWWSPDALPGSFSGHRECKQCGRLFACGRAEVYHTPRYCSNACRRQARHTAEVARRAKRRRDALRLRWCEHCGSRLEAQRATRRYCSDRCRVAALRARRAQNPPS